MFPLRRRRPKLVLLPPVPGRRHGRPASWDEEDDDLGIDTPGMRRVILDDAQRSRERWMVVSLGLFALTLWLAVLLVAAAGQAGWL